MTIDSVQLKRGTAAALASVNPVLKDGEPCWDRTNNIIKIGDGSTEWNDLETAFKSAYTANEPTTYVEYAGGFVSKVTTASGVTENIQRDASGRVEQFDYRGVTFEVARDGDGRVTGVEELS